MSWAKDEWKQDLPSNVLTNIEELEKEGANWKRLNQQQQLQLENLEAALEKQHQATAKEKATNLELNRHIQDISNRFAELENKYEKAGKELQGRGKKIVLLEEQLQKSKQKVKNESDRVAELEAELNNKQQQLDQRTSEKEMLSSQLKKREGERVKQTEGQQGDQEPEPEVKTSNGSLTGMLKRENAGLVRENEEVKRQRDRMKHLLEEKDREIDRLNDKLSASRSELDITLRALREIEGIAERLRAELGDKETRIASLVGDRDTLRKENEKFSKELDCFKLQSEAARDEHASLAKEFERSQKVVKSLENRLGSKTNLLKEKQQRLDTLEVRNAKQAEELKQVKGKSKTTKQSSVELEDSKQVVRSLENLLSAKEASVEQQEERVHLLFEENKGLKKHLERLSSENEQTNSSYKSVCKALDESRKALQHLQGECASLSDQLEEGRKQVEHLERENTRLCVEVDCLQLPDEDHDDDDDGQARQEVDILKDQLASKRHECQALKLELKSKQEKYEADMREAAQQLETLKDTNRALKDTATIAQQRLVGKLNENVFCKGKDESATNTVGQIIEGEEFGVEGGESGERLDVLLQQLANGRGKLQSEAEKCIQTTDDIATWPGTLNADCSKERSEIESLCEKAHTLLDAFCNSALKCQAKKTDIRKRLFQEKVEAIVLRAKVGPQIVNGLELDGPPAKRPCVHTYGEPLKGSGEYRGELSEKETPQITQPRLVSNISCDNKLPYGGNNIVKNGQTPSLLHNKSCQTSESGPGAEVMEGNLSAERVDMSWDDYPDNAAFRAYRSEVDAIVQQLNQEKEFVLRKQEELEGLKQEQEAVNGRRRAELATYVHELLSPQVTVDGDPDEGASHDPAEPRQVIIMGVDKMTEVMRELLHENNKELEKKIRQANMPNILPVSHPQPPCNLKDESGNSNAVVKESKHRSLAKCAMNDLDIMKNKVEDVQKIIKHFVFSISSSCREQDTIRSQINLLDEELKEKTSQYEIKCRDLSKTAQNASDQEIHLRSRLNALTCEKEEINAELREVFDSLKEKELELVANSQQLKNLQAQHDEIQGNLQKKIKALEQENESLWNEYKEASERAEQSGLESKGVVDQLTSARGYLLNLFESLSNVDDGLQQARDMGLYE